MLCENIHLLLICHQQHVVSLAYDLDWKYTGASLHLFRLLVIWRHVQYKALTALSTGVLCWGSQHMVNEGLYN